MIATRSMTLIRRKRLQRRTGAQRLSAMRTGGRGLVEPGGSSGMETQRSSEGGACDAVPLRRHRLQLRGRLRERDVCDLVAVQRSHPAESSLVHEIRRLEAVARREHAVARGRAAAALHVAEDGYARLVPGSLFDLAREHLPHAAEPDVSERVRLLSPDRPALAGIERELVPLADDDDREVLAAVVPAAELAAGRLDRHPLLRDQDHVRAARDSAHHGDPADVAAHHLDDHHPVVRFRRRVQPVYRLRRDEDRGVEAERVIGRREVVVDRLRNADDREVVLLVEPRCDPERVLAADRHERVETLFPGRLQDPFDAAVDLVGIRARRAEDGAALRQEARDFPWPERLEQSFDEPPPALADADDLIPAIERTPGDGADDRIQAGAVAAAREDSDPRRHAPIMADSRSGGIWSDTRASKARGALPRVGSSPTSGT